MCVKVDNSRKKKIYSKQHSQDFSLVYFYVWYWQLYNDLAHEGQTWAHSSEKDEKADMGPLTRIEAVKMKAFTMHHVALSHNLGRGAALSTGTSWINTVTRT